MATAQAYNVMSEQMATVLRQAPMLEAEREQELACQAREGSEAAFNALVDSHLRLAAAIAQEFRFHGVPIDDLVSEGVLGLVEAARRFEPERGVRLAAYATWWIRAYIRRYTVANRRIVRAPSTRNGRKLLAKLRKTQRELVHAGQEADSHAVADALGVEVEDVTEMEGALSGRDVPLGADEEGRVYDVADETPGPEDAAIASQARERCSAEVAHALAMLDGREREIVRERYLAGDKASLASIGRHMGLSRERVRQLEGRAQEKMRHAIMDCVA